MWYYREGCCMCVVVFWVLLPCSIVDCDRRFGYAQFLHHRERNIYLTRFYVVKFEIVTTIWIWLPSGLSHLVVWWKFMDVSEVHSASIIRPTHCRRNNPIDNHLQCFIRSVLYFCQTTYLIINTVYSTVTDSIVLCVLLDGDAPYTTVVDSSILAVPHKTGSLIMELWNYSTVTLRMLLTASYFYISSYSVNAITEMFACVWIKERFDGSTCTPFY